MRPDRPKRPTHPMVRGALIGVILGPLVGIAFLVASALQTRYFRPFSPGTTVSEKQIRAAASAVATFAKEKGHRPQTLEEAVQEGMVGAGELLDAKQGPAPAIDANTGRFAESPDVIYFPALRADDPGDLVLLCTFLVHREGDSYHVIYNDGHYAALGPHELVQAINRTYAYLASRIWTPPSTGPTGGED